MNISIENGIIEEARRADANAQNLLRSYNNRYSLRWMFAEQNQLILNALGSSGRILEVGCGIGNFLVDAARADTIHQVYAVEVGLRTAQIAREAAANKCFISLAPAERLPFQTESFDGVVARGVLHHLSDPTAGICEMYRVLKRGCKLVILEGNPASKYRRFMLGIADTLSIPHEDTHYRHLWPEEITEKLSIFRQIQVRSINGLFAPLNYVGFGGRRTWNMLTGIRNIISHYQPDSFDWWKLWVAHK